MRVIDKKRLVKRKGKIRLDEIQSIKEIIRETYID
jgi:hypothetical protein